MIERPISYQDLTDAQKLIIAQLSERDISDIDKLILSQSSSKYWRTQAMVISKTMRKLINRFPEIPDSYYAMRISQLVKDGKLESYGDLKFGRFSEVRLPVSE